VVDDSNRRTLWNRLNLLEIGETFGGNPIVEDTGYFVNDNLDIRDSFDVQSANVRTAQFDILQLEATARQLSQDALATDDEFSNDYSGEIQAQSDLLASLTSLRDALDIDIAAEQATVTAQNATINSLTATKATRTATKASLTSTKTSLTATYNELVSDWSYFVSVPSVIHKATITSTTVTYLHMTCQNISGDTGWNRTAGTVELSVDGSAYSASSSKQTTHDARASSNNYFTASINYTGAGDMDIDANWDGNLLESFSHTY